MSNELKGIHHVTAITSSAEKIYDFFTNVLGLRLVKKTVNQDDINTYHLFFADDMGSPGTDITFFDFVGISQAKRGTNEISRTGFRVKDDRSFEYFKKRFDFYHIKHSEITMMFKRKTLFFEDFDEGRYALFSDENIEGVKAGTPWKKGPVPDEFAITGLGPIFLTVNKINQMHVMLTEVLGMVEKQKEKEYTLYEMGIGGNGASVIVTEDKFSRNGIQGYGGVHHVAFRVSNLEELSIWQERLNKFGAPNSGLVDRFYFNSLYTRLYPNMLFEIATDDPGFIDDEEGYDILGETLALPPKFRKNRDYIEKIVRPIDTVRSNKIFKKEYFND
ncbi:MAG: VOC family protein [Acholeplasma sp.]|nr:VOC family protein [Acholeplasma sp.]